ncbi:uncharacterized protein LOC131148634 [Malania oleifera]|uniref:uncharacterized protein LOC131148634 n=1 Tax=Malania oleifera TaxID=397392 RepID=UPI0025AE182A|nr:uncharacterized protein LOC131148634 [Malania oleifera]
MAVVSVSAVSLHPHPSGAHPPTVLFLKPKHSHRLFKPCRPSSPLPLPPPPPPSFRTAASPSDGTEDRVAAEKDPPAAFSGSLSSTRTQLDLLGQLTSASSFDDGPGYESDSSSRKLTVKDQLAQIVGDRDDDFSIPLGKNLKKFSAKFLTIAQKRNIKRQAYLEELSQRNDTAFFATIAAFVISPPLIILGIAIAIGYVQLFP